jgi:hypothetical protein
MKNARNGPNNNSPHTNRRAHFGFGRRLSGFLGHWIHCQRPFPAAVILQFLKGFAGVNRPIE